MRERLRIVKCFSLAAWPVFECESLLSGGTRANPGLYPQEVGQPALLFARVFRTCRYKGVRRFSGMAVECVFFLIFHVGPGICWLDEREKCSRSGIGQNGWTKRGEESSCQTNPRRAKRQRSQGGSRQVGKCQESTREKEGIVN